MGNQASIGPYNDNTQALSTHRLHKRHKVKSLPLPRLVCCNFLWGENSSIPIYAREEEECINLWSSCVNTGWNAIKGGGHICNTLMHTWKAARNIKWQAIWNDSDSLSYISIYMIDIYISDWTLLLNEYISNKWTCGRIIGEATKPKAAENNSIARMAFKEYLQR